MEAGSQKGVLQKLLDGLCQETDPGKIYKLLKKLSSMPILCDSLAEIGFRQTIKCLKKQQLLIPFAKDLVAKWFTGSLLGPQPEQIKQDIGLVLSLPKEHQSNSREDKPQECATQEPRGVGREVFLGFSSLDPGRISRLKPNAGSHTRSDRRTPQSRSLDPGENWSDEQQLAGQNQGQVLPPSKKKRKPSGLAELQRLPGELPRGESGSSKDQSPIAAWAIPESPTTGQGGFSWDVVQEPSSSRQDQEPSTWEWAIRKNHKTRVYSGVRPGAGLQQKSHHGLLAEEQAGARDAARCQAAKVEAQPGQPEEKCWPENETCKQTHSRPESPTGLQLQESQEERLQRLRARIQCARAKRLQDRQTRMISFHTQLKSPALQPEPGPTGAASAQNPHCLPEASAQAGAQRPSSLLTGERGNQKAPAKRPAPLMAKAIRDYSHRYSKK